MDCARAGNGADEKPLICHIAGGKETGNGGIAGKGLQRKAAPGAGGTHKAGDPFHGILERINAAALAGGEERGHNAIAEFAVFLAHVLEIEVYRAAAFAHFCGHGAHENMQESAVLVDGVVPVHERFPQRVGETAAKTLKTAHAADVEIPGRGVVAVGELHVREFGSGLEGHGVAFAGLHVLAVVLSLEAATAGTENGVSGMEDMKLPRTDIKTGSTDHLPVICEQISDLHAVDNGHPQFFQPGAQLSHHLETGEHHGMVMAAAGLALEPAVGVLFKIHAPFVHHVDYFRGASGIPFHPLGIEHAAAVSVPALQPLVKIVFFGIEIQDVAGGKAAFTAAPDPCLVCKHDAAAGHGRSNGPHAAGHAAAKNQNISTLAFSCGNHSVSLR